MVREAAAEERPCWHWVLRRGSRGTLFTLIVATLAVLTAASLGRPITARAQVPPGCTQVGVTVTCSFGFTGGEQTFAVPAGIASVEVTAIGAAGASNPTPLAAPGGEGAEVRGTLTGLVPGQTLYVEVGGGATGGGSCGAGVNCNGGFNGGGSSNEGGGGGGATDVRIAPRTTAGSLGTRLVVAAGGGGFGAPGTPPCDSDFLGQPGGNAGAAGGTSTCSVTGDSSTGGGAGTQTAGGSAGTPRGGTGTLGLGGNGGDLGRGASITGGGGGGGLYGGGGGGGGVLVNGVQFTVSGGGGGGSSLVPPGGGLVLTTAGPSVTISYGPPREMTTISTKPSAGGAVGAAISDTATVSGGSGPTGSVSFRLYGPGDATCSGTPLFTSTATLSVGGSADSGSYTPIALGTYHWVAAYGGDANNLPVTSTCATEPVTVSQATPTVATMPSAGGAVGTAISDSATVTGGFKPSGGVTFRLYGPDDPICGGTALFTSTDSLSGGSADSGSYTTNAVGTYHWVATYDGDADNLPIGSACAVESVTVSQSSLTLGTTPPGGGVQGPSTSSSTPGLSQTASALPQTSASSPAAQGPSTSDFTPGLPNTGAPPATGGAPWLLVVAMLALGGMGLVALLAGRRLAMRPPMRRPRLRSTRE